MNSEVTYAPDSAATAPSAAPAAVVPAYPTYQESWLVLGWFLLMALAVGAVFFAAARLAGLPHRYSLVVTMLAGDAAKALVVVFLIWYVGRQRVAPLRLLARQERPGVYLALLLLAGAQLLLRSGLRKLDFLPSWGLESTLARMAEFPLAAGFTICVAAPVLEELLMRGLVLPGLERNYGPARAILQSSLVFGVFHLNPAQALSAFLLGLLLGWVYVRTRSLAACIWLHFLNNAAAWGLGLLPALRRYDSPADLLPAGWVGAAAVATVAALLGLGLLALARLTRPAPEPAAA